LIEVAGCEDLMNVIDEKEQKGVTGVRGMVRRDRFSEANIYTTNIQGR
jgi:hypothetical protein